MEKIGLHCIDDDKGPLRELKLIDHFTLRPHYKSSFKMFNDDFGYYYLQQNCAMTQHEYKSFSQLKNTIVDNVLFIFPNGNLSKCKCFVISNSVLDMGIVDVKFKILEYKFYETERDYISE